MAKVPAPALVAAEVTDLPAIRALLTDAGLPVADLGDSTHAYFWLARDRERVLGTVALERFGDVAMLRSLAVRRDRQGGGLGQALLKTAEQCASETGIRTLCLLTTTAERFFARHGYAQIQRSEAPEAARQSEEFRSLCPASAVCMIKRLDIR